MEKKGVSNAKKNSWKFLILKLRTLLLMEEDCNALHKINFNGRIMPTIETSSAMLQEIIVGRRSHAAMHLALSKKLIADISNTKKLSTATTYADSTN